MASSQVTKMSLRTPDPFYTLGHETTPKCVMLFLVSASELCPQSPSEALLHVCLRSLTRGCHLYVLCRSVCDQDQNWIKRSSLFWAWSMRPELLKSMDQEHTVAVWPLTLCKASTQEPQKGTIKWLSTLFADQNLDPGHKHLKIGGMWLPHGLSRSLHCN